MLSRYIKYFSFLFVYSFSLFSQEDYVNDNQLRYEDYTYKKGIKTVQLYESTWEFSQPIIEFNTAQQLLLSFDEMDADRKIYQMSVVHCDSKWAPSDLMISEYLTGFFDLILKQ